MVWAASTVEAVWSRVVGVMISSLGEEPWRSADLPNCMMVSSCQETLNTQKPSRFLQFEAWEVEFVA
jgi:hypothetical protein